MQTHYSETVSHSSGMPIIILRSNVIIFSTFFAKLPHFFRNNDNEGNKTVAIFWFCLVRRVFIVTNELELNFHESLFVCGDPMASSFIFQMLTTATIIAQTLALHVLNVHARQRRRSKSDCSAKHIIIYYSKLKLSPDSACWHCALSLVAVIETATEFPLWYTMSGKYHQINRFKIPHCRLRES